MLFQQTSKTESESYDSSYEQRLPILAELVMYYCRFAARPALIQLYQAEVRNIVYLKYTNLFPYQSTIIWTGVGQRGS